MLYVMRWGWSLEVIDLRLSGCQRASCFSLSFVETFLGISKYTVGKYGKEWWVNIIKFFKFSGFTYNFELQNQFLHRKFYAKNQESKNGFFNPKKTFSYKTYEKNFVLLKKFAL